MKQILFIFGFLVTTACAWAFDTQTDIQEANASYSKGDFAGALAKYKAVADTGYASAELYFNLGNAYYKTKNIKSAILYYEKAKLLAPDNKDIAYNLEMAYSFTTDKIEAMPELFFISWFKWIRNLFSVDTWAVISVLTFILALALFLVYLLSAMLILKKVSLWLGVVLVALSVSAYVSGSSLKQMQTKANTAIVFSPSVTVKSSPAESGNNLFVIHEGAKVEVLDQVGEWREIRIADGNRGWLKVIDIEKI